MSLPLRIIRTRGLNRWLFYIVPAVFVVFGTLDYWDLRALGTSPRDALVDYAWAAAIVLLCECFFFGFQLRCHGDRIVYRYLGFPLFLSKSVELRSIRAAVFESAIRFDYKPFTFVELTTEQDGRRKIVRMTLVSFPRREIEWFLDWLPVKVQGWNA